MGNSNNSYGLRLGHLWSRKIGYAWLLYRGSIILAVNKRKEHVLVLLLLVIQLWWICLSFLFLMFTSQVNMWCFPRAKSQGIILVQRTIKYNYFFFHNCLLWQILISCLLLLYESQFFSIIHEHLWQSVCYYNYLDAKAILGVAKSTQTHLPTQLLIGLNGY